LIGTYSYNLLVSANKVKSILKYTIITSLVEFALMPVLIPEFKGVGLTVLLFVVAPLVGNVMYINGLRSMFGISIRVKKILRVVLANVISFAFVFIARC